MINFVMRFYILSEIIEKLEHKSKTEYENEDIIE